MCRKNIFELTVFSKNFWNSSLLSDCVKNILQHWRRKFGKYVKTAIYFNKKLFEETLFWEENTYIDKFFELWLTNLRTSVRKPSKRFERLLSTLVQANFLHNIIFFFRENVRLLTEFENFSIFHEVFKFLVAFRLWGKHFEFFVELIWLGCQNCFQLSRDTFGRVVFWKKFLWIVCFFWTPGTNFLDFRRKLFNRFVKIAFYVSRGGNWLDCFFYEFFWVSSLFSDCAKNLLQHWRKIFKKISQNCILLEQQNFSRKICFFCILKKIITFTIFSSFDQKLCGRLQESLTNCFSYEFFQLLDCFPTVGRTFCNNVSKTLENLLQLPSTWTTKLFEENLFSEEKTYFYNFFELWSKTLRTFVEKHSTRFQKLLSTLVHGIFLHIIIIFLEKLYAY